MGHRSKEVDQTGLLKKKRDKFYRVLWCTEASNISCLVLWLWRNPHDLSGDSIPMEGNLIT